jgi:hypothetical protein
VRSRLRRLVPKPSVVLPLIAIFFAIGGIGYAASKIGTNDIKNGAVTKKKLHKNAVVSKKVKNHSLKCVDVRYPCPGAKGPTGPVGPRGATGPAGPAAGGTQTGQLVTIATAQATPTEANGGIKVLASNEGFQWELVCSGTSANPTTTLQVRNVSAGNDAHIQGALTFPGGGSADNFDQGQTAAIAQTNSNNASNPSGFGFGTSTLIYGTAGTTQMGWGGVLNNPSGFPGDPDCAGSLNLLVL